MIYSFDITTEANVTESAPLRTPLRITRGLIYQVEVEFPPGPLGLCHVTIWDGGYQVWPSNPDQSFHGDGGYITFPDTYLKFSAPFELLAKTWNRDDTWPHTIHLRLGIVSDEVFMARYLPSMTYDKMLETLGALQIQQESERAAVIAAPLPWKDGR